MRWRLLHCMACTRLRLADGRTWITLTWFMVRAEGFSKFALRRWEMDEYASKIGEGRERRERCAEGNIAASARLWERVGRKWWSRAVRGYQRGRLGRANGIKDNSIEVAGWLEPSEVSTREQSSSYTISQVDPFIIVVHAKLDPSSANTSLGFTDFRPVIRVISVLRLESRKFPVCAAESSSSHLRTIVRNARFLSLTQRRDNGTLTFFACLRKNNQ